MFTQRGKAVVYSNSLLLYNQVFDDGPTHACVAPVRLEPGILKLHVNPSLEI